MDIMDFHITIVFTEVCIMTKVLSMNFNFTINLAMKRLVLESDVRECETTFFPLTCHVTKCEVGHLLCKN